MKTGVLLLALLGLQGCAETLVRREVARLEGICEIIGYQKDTDAMRNCVLQLGRK